MITRDLRHFKEVYGGGSTPPGRLPRLLPFGPTYWDAAEEDNHIPAPADRGKTLLAITNAIVSLHREFYGRGATKGRTIMQDNLVLCVLEDIYTKAERTLIDAGRFTEVHHARNAFQETMEERFSKAVAEITGREVVAFFSQVRTDPDMASEVFVLAPDGSASN